MTTASSTMASRKTSSAPKPAKANMKKHRAMRGRKSQGKGKGNPASG